MRSHSKISLLCVFEALFILYSCKPPANKAGANSRTASTPQRTVGTRPSLFGSHTTSTANLPRSISLEEAKALFKDASDFVPNQVFDNVDKGCIDAFGASGQNIRPWPPEMKAFLAEELSHVPFMPSLKSRFLGFYYASFSDGGNLDGLSCFFNDNKRSAIALNIPIFTRAKVSLKLPVNAVGLIASYQSNNILHIVPDDMIQTLIHELFHVVDFTSYMNVSIENPTPARKTLMSFSWENPDSSKFPVASAAVENLSSHARTGSILCPSRMEFALTAGSSTVGFNFLGQVPEAVARAIQETNFLNDYSMSNALEDFAETLSIYYMATRYNQYGLYNIYDRDMMTLGTQGQVTYSFDELELMRNSKAHHEKVCAMVKEVLKEDCAAGLAPIVSEL